MPLWDLFLTMLWFFLFIAWVWLMFAVIGDLFRNDMSGWAKALWALFLIALPFVGVFAYVVAHGGTMQERIPNRGVALDLGRRNRFGTPAPLSGQGVMSSAEFNARLAAPLR
jgi:hypothetical protein